MINVEDLGFHTCPTCGGRFTGKACGVAHDPAGQDPQPTRAPRSPRKPARTAKRELEPARLHHVTAGQVAIREAAEGETASDGLTIEGYAYRWGELTAPGATAEYGELQEGFERGAFIDAIAARGDRPFPFLARHGGQVVGSVRFTEDDTGLRFDGRLLDQPAAREYAATIPAGADGVSLEFMYHGARSVKRGKTIMHRSIPRIAALAGAYVQAFTGATVAAREIAGGSTVNTCPHCGVELELGVAHVCQVAIAAAAEREAATRPAAMTSEAIRELAQDAAVEVMRGMAERGGFGVSAVDPLAGYGSLGALFAAAGETPHGDELRRYAARALADTVFTAGANAGLASGNLVSQTIHRIVDQSRPIITAFGGPANLGDTAGLTLEYAYFNGTLADRVAAQSAEKAEIESLAVDIALGTEALVTYAGGSDISYQTIRRGTPSIIDAFARITLAAWAVVTDAAAATELETGSVTVDYAEALSAHDLTEFTANFITASLAVEAATGQPAEFVLASTTAWTKLAQLIAPSSTQIVAAGSLDLRGLRINVGGLPIIHAAGITADKVIISNRAAGRWHEDGPFQAAAEDVAKLGRNVAYWSMGAFVRYVPAAIVEAYDVTP